MEKEETTEQMILRAINRLGNWELDVAKEIANDHPTLQQTFMRLCLDYIKVQSEKDMHMTDLRNEATVKLAKRIKSLLDSQPDCLTITYLPLV